jgi:hypothetical protein
MKHTKETEQAVLRYTLRYGEYSSLCVQIWRLVGL